MAGTLFFRQTLNCPRELDDVSGSGAEGVGLYRTEFLYLNRSKPPDEKLQQDENYRLVAELIAALFRDHPNAGYWRR